MVLFIGGPSHTGKTCLAQRLLEKYGVPYLSIDHLKMGLIRSGQTDLTPESGGEALTRYLWPVLRGMAATAVENGQDLVVEGCYIPYDWRKDFPESYLAQIRAVWLVMSQGYIRRHFDEIQRYASVVEHRLDDSGFTMELALEDNARALELCGKHGVDCLLIDGEYSVDLELPWWKERGRRDETAAAHRG